MVRNRDGNTYFDFADRIFGGVVTSATAPLTSAIDGLYRTAWDVSGLFTTNAFLLFEYHDGTSLAIDDVMFVRPPLSTGDAGHGGVAGIINKGSWNIEEKEKLFDKLKDIKSDLVDFKRKSLILLRDILSKKQLQKEDLDKVLKLKEYDFKMYQELLKILDLKNNSTEREVLEKLEKYVANEEMAKVKVLNKLTELLGKKKVEDNGDDD